MGRYVPMYDLGVRPNRDHEKLEKVLVDGAEKFRAMADDFRASGARVCGFDTETAPMDEYTKKSKWGAAALSPEHSFLVGCSLAFGLERGYYLPFGHRLGTNLPTEAFVELEKLLLAAERVVYWNAKHDLRIQRANGHSRWRDIEAFDAGILAWNADTNAGSPRLKDTARTALGWTMPTFEETLGGEPDASWLSPEQALPYAALDALAPLHLTKHFKDVWKKCRVVVDVDNAIVPVVSDMEDAALPLDISIAEDVKAEITPERKRVVKRMRELLGDEEYDPGKNCMNNATKDAFAKLGIDTGERTATGNMSMSEDALKGVRHAHEFVELVLKIKELGSLGSKVDGMLRDYREDLGGSRFQYSINRVATGRFSSGNGAKNPYFAGYGIQNVLKSPKVPYLATPESECREVELLPGAGLTILGWHFEPLSEEDDGSLKTQDGLLVSDAEGRGDVHGVLTEGFVRERNIRRAFVPHEGHVFLHVDYASEELRIPANLSGDPMMVKIFTEGLDMHRITAEELFGKENYGYATRKKAKPLNFGLLYGGGPGLIADAVGCSIEEAKVYYNKWWNLYGGLRRWRDAQVKHGVDYGYVLTAFGRMRWVRREYEENRAWRGRNESINSPVQGTAGDMMRVALLKLSRNVLPKYGDRLRKLMMVHDEINFSCHPDSLWDATGEIAAEMDIRLPGWQVPMVAEYEVGPSWGEVFPFEKDEDNRVWVPAGRRV